MALSTLRLMKARAAGFLSNFRKEKEGTMTIEMVITLPLLFWMITTSFELFEVHQYKSVRIKATYTVADLLSREMMPVNETYMDTAKTIFDSQTNDGGETQVRMSVVSYDSASATYQLDWSKIRGQGPMSVLTEADVRLAHSELPILDNGEQLIIVESLSTYQPTFIYPGLNNSYTSRTKVFNGVRFSSNLCWEGQPDECDLS